MTTDSDFAILEVCIAQHSVTGTAKSAGAEKAFDALQRIRALVTGSTRPDKQPGESERDYDHRLVLALLVDGLSQLPGELSLKRQAFDAFKRLMAPLPVRLHCPARRDDGTMCGALHVDQGEWTTKPHHTHSCQKCGHTWRPAVAHTVGVEFLPGFKNEPEALAGDTATDLALVFRRGQMGFQGPTGAAGPWRPTLDSWARICAKDSSLHGTIVRLVSYAGLTGTFAAEALDGKMLFVSQDDLGPWVPKIDGTERVKITLPNNIPAFGTATPQLGHPGLFLVKLEKSDQHKFSSSITELNGLEPAPPLPPDPKPEKLSGFKVGDPVRVTKKESELCGSVWRVQEVKVVSGVEWIVLEGFRGLIDPGILEHWQPREGEPVIHKKSGARTTVTRCGVESMTGPGIFYLGEDFEFNGRHWFETSELSPVIGTEEHPINYHSIWRYRDGWEGVAESDGPGYILCGPSLDQRYRWDEEAFRKAFTWVRNS